MSQTTPAGRYAVRMPYVLRHVLSVFILPVTVVVAVPLWIAREYAVRASWPASPTGWGAAAAGAAMATIGLALFTASLRHFAIHGRGTLAPWDPPRRLVVRGPYRYVRNPMISGVIFMLSGLALGLRSAPHATWAACFMVANLLQIPLLEEPQLEARFGSAYRRYRSAVPRFVPRTRPWTDPG
jgi:protein-S-isoprenylcysteine O-methyltransferase Ste14